MLPPTDGLLRGPRPVTSGRLPRAGSQADHEREAPPTMSSRLSWKVRKGVHRQTLAMKKRKSAVRNRGPRKGNRERGDRAGHADAAWRGVGTHGTGPAPGQPSAVGRSSAARGLSSRGRNGERGGEREERQSAFVRMKSSAMCTVQDTR